MLSILILGLIIAVTPIASYVIEPILPRFGVETENLQLSLWRGSINADQVLYSSSRRDIEIEGLSINGLNILKKSIDQINATAVEVRQKGGISFKPKSSKGASAWMIKSLAVDKVVVHLGPALGHISVESFEYQASARDSGVLRFKYKGRQYEVEVSSKLQWIKALLELRSNLPMLDNDAISEVTEKLKLPFLS